MHIGVDISLLRIAQAGVLTYHRSLLNHLVRAGRDCRFTLIDVLPLNPGRSMPPLAALDAPNVRVIRCPGIRRSYLSALPAFRDGIAHTVTAQIDHALDPIWARLARAEMGLELRGASRFVEVFHASDQLPFVPPGAAVVLTIHDLTTRRFPEMHVAENAALHATKERFARTRADRIIAVSEATRRDIVSELGIPPERISVVYEAADARFRPHTPDETRTILERYDLVHRCICAERRHPRTAKKLCPPDRSVCDAPRQICASRTSAATDHRWRQWMEVRRNPGSAGTDRRRRVRPVSWARPR
jgi:glycosyltransferase involved in cell wall biosynthesis